MIYIVEDDQSISNGFIMLFKSAGYDCNNFGSAEKFLDFYTVGENDLLILDMQLSGMNGCKLLETLAKRGLYIPVIVISSYDEQKYRKCSKEYGAIEYLRKPVDGEALLDIIQFKLLSEH